MKPLCKLLCMIAVLGLLLVDVSYATMITGTGHIYNTSKGGVIDNWYFNVGTSSQVTIDTAFLGGYGFDSEMYLFKDDRDFTADDFVAWNDDYRHNGYTSRESHIDKLLNEGNYLLRVSEWYFDDPTALWEDSVTGDWHYRLNISGDNVSFNPAPVPEPSTFILFGAGLVGLLAMRKMRRT